MKLSSSKHEQTVYDNFVNAKKAIAEIDHMETQLDKKKALDAQMQHHFDLSKDVMLLAQEQIITGCYALN